ncbi:PAAR domain-containing protein [Desulfovibrio litoralis]|uniref:Zn-binding Pro-Ala-Ala-Arg (PAAR) domain-containing protein, incolved in TypeVI secretion n=1 Tax=Desulfovibrio litoralis DSM 11393 TaxID=1121455 RepID=A0A1M7SPN1_9BACT|nr:PAAR domain-containing protein [Desulfovibrio litoralis]SHN60412.1 Zn-binding Pro-Ala-Ala-Arg (PAAR) domain-containing protein, incolved in TypeVI secretion [Desulfovibrio litoralis DSM 11393]
MAQVPIACLGDTGSHGGKIITGAETIMVHGRPIARVGDIYDCPEHGPNPIITGAKSVFGRGRQVAHIGSRTACGATITSGCPNATLDVTLLSDEIISPQSANFESECNYDEQILAINKTTGQPIAYYPYFIELVNGKTYFGRTDEYGYTQRIDSLQSAENFIVFWGGRCC